MSVRLFIPTERLAGRLVDLQADESGYLVRVRRLNAGEAVEVFDGRGGRWNGVLQPGRATLAIRARAAERSGRRFSFELWQGLAKGERMEWVIQKATELGVKRIVPLASERAVVRLSPARAALKLQRWQKIAQEAARQSGRSDVPEVAGVASLAELTRLAQAGSQVALLYEREGQKGLQPFLNRLASGAHVALAVGPEGGFEPHEVEMVAAAGAALLGLGERVLRTETAAIAVCALALAASGGMGSQEI